METAHFHFETCLRFFAHYNDKRNIIVTCIKIQVVAETFSEPENLSRKRRAVFKFLQKLLSNHNVHLQICQSFLWIFAKIVISQVYEFVVLIEKCV